MTGAELIHYAIESTRMVQVAPRAYTVDTYDAGRRAWVQGVQMDWHKARRALSECRVYQSARAAGYDIWDAEGWAGTYAARGGDWREFVRAMVNESR